MSTGVPNASRNDRVLLLALTARDGAAAQDLLRSAGIVAEACASFDALLRELGDGAAAIVIAEEHLSAEANKRLATLLGAQPAWSDLPLLLLTGRGADSEVVGNAIRTLGNVTLIERPLRFTTLISSVRTAVRARARQYQIRSHVEQQERAAEALRAADRRKDEFLATLGHELRNPLAPLTAGLQLLRLTGSDDPRLAKIATIMERQVSHLVRLVDDLLEVSRITRGVIDVRREPLDLVALLRSALDTTRAMFEASRHELTVDLPAETMTVAGDPVRLTQVFTNLLTNAAKYTNTGGRVSVTVRRAGERVEISVRDNGIGISPAHLEMVFEMFTQVDRQSRRSQGGLGIGLTLVRSLVTMHGGAIEARSDGPGTGSEFIVTLPLLAYDEAAVKGAEPLAAFPERRILVVDDNCDAADTLSALLRELGATTAVAYAGGDALDLLERFRPDAVLLDIGMPEMDGYEVARRMRTAPNVETPLLIALTGWGQDEDLLRSRQAGFDHHLVKPPDVEHLRGLLVRE